MATEESSNGPKGGSTGNQGSRSRRPIWIGAGIATLAVVVVILYLPPPPPIPTPLPGPPDRFNAALILCGAGIEQGAKAGLVAQYNETKGDISAAVERSVRIPVGVSGDAEGTKRYLAFLSCVEARLRPADKCTAANPCVDITRVADFSKSSCNAETGARTDFAVFSDTVRITPQVDDKYEPIAQPTRSAALKLFSFDKASRYEVPPQEQPCPSCTAPKYKFAVPASDGIARYEWEWTNGHPDSKDEGLAFISPYKIRSVLASVVLPQDVHLSKPRFEPATAPCVATPTSFTCQKMDDIAASQQPIKWLWDWPIWDKCKKDGGAEIAASAAPPVGASTTAAAVSGNDIQSGPSSATKP